MVAIERALTKVKNELEGLRSVEKNLTNRRAHLVKLAVAEGMSHRAVAELLWVSHTAVQKMLHDHGGTADGWCSCPGMELARRALVDEERADLRKANRGRLNVAER